MVIFELDDELNQSKTSLFGGSGSDSVMRIEKPNGFCAVCSGNGFPGGCPNCGKDSLMRGHDEVQVVTEDDAKRILIPPQYTRVKWDPERILAGHPNVQNISELKAYVNTLNYLYKTFEQGLLPERSAVIVAPRTYGKQTLAYCCMIQALAHGYTVAPVIDNMQYKRLRRLAADRPLSKTLKDMAGDIELYDSADVVFMTIDISNYLEAFTVVEALTTRRARLGKPTFTLSRFSLTQLAHYCGNVNFKTFINNGSQIDTFKYPMLISYWEQNI